MSGGGVARALVKFEKMYVEVIDNTTATKIVQVLCIVAKSPSLQHYYFLTDHVCNALGIKHYYNLTNPKKSVHNTARLASMLSYRRKVICQVFHSLV